MNITQALKFVQIATDKKLVEFIVNTYSKNQVLAKELTEVEHSDKTFEEKINKYESSLGNSNNFSKMIESLRDDELSQKYIEKYKTITECRDSIGDETEFYQTVYRAVMIVELLSVPLTLICVVSNNPIFCILGFLLTGVGVVLVPMVILRPRLHRLVTFLGYKALEEITKGEI